MNRRNFFKGIAVLPLAVVAPKAVPAPVAAAPRVTHTFVLNPNEEQRQYIKEEEARLQKRRSH